MVSQTRCKIIIFFRLHQIKLNLSSDIPVFFCFQHCFTTQNNASLPLPSRSNRKPDAFPAIATTLPTTRQSIKQTYQRTPSQIRSCHVPDSVVSRPRFGCVSSQVRLRLVPGSLSNRGSLTEIISLNPEMVIPPSLPSIIRKTDWSILQNKKTIGFSIILSDISATSPTATLSRSTQIAFLNIKPHLLPTSRPNNLLKTRASKLSIQIKKGHLIAQMSFFEVPSRFELLYTVLQTAT